jgi:hypothetical protein
MFPDKYGELWRQLSTPWRVYPRWKREEVGCLVLRTFPCREESGWILVDPQPSQ